MRRLARARHLGWRDVLLVLAAWVRLLVVDYRIRHLGVDRTARLVRPAVATTATTEQVARARSYARWLRITARYHPVNAQCLHQSLALHHWLRAEGIPSSMDIGVAMNKGHLRAHAWVRVGDQLVGDSPAEIAPFAPLTAGGSPAWR